MASMLVKIQVTSEIVASTIRVGRTKGMVTTRFDLQVTKADFKIKPAGHGEGYQLEK